MLKIDGAFGEGGGQIVRTALALSCVTKKPIRLENIRMGRKKPGLRPQHVTAIGLLGDACNAKVRGAGTGSTWVEFVPQEMEDAKLSADVGTAGSISLILQMLVPAVSLCKKRLSLSIGGGTDVPWSPTAEYTKKVLGEAYARMGIDFSIKVGGRGYYPRGGGRADVRVFPCGGPKPIVLGGRRTGRAQLYCSFSKIPGNEIENAVGRITGELESSSLEVESFVTGEDARDGGASVLVACIDDGYVAGIDALYETDRKGFGLKGIKEFASGACIDEHLSDMLVVPASIADGMSVFRVGRISGHLATNLHTASQITGCRYGIGKTDEGFEVRIDGNSDSGI